MGCSLAHIRSFSPAAEEPSSDREAEKPDIGEAEGDVP